MAEPACSEDVPEPARPDPRADGWADVRRAMITEARAASLALAEIAARPGDEAALEMGAAILAVLESLREIGRRCAVEAALIEAERARGFAEGAAACKAARDRLAVIDGGRAG